MRNRGSKDKSRASRGDLAEVGRNMLRPYLFGAKGAEGIDLGGAAGWQVAGG